MKNIIQICLKQKSHSVSKFVHVRSLILIIQLQKIIKKKIAYMVIRTKILKIKLRLDIYQILYFVILNNYPKVKR